jgi:hypothetical protein
MNTNSQLLVRSGINMRAVLIGFLVWAVVIIVGITALTFIFGFNPSLFFVFYGGAAALALLGLSFILLSGGVFSAGAFQRGLILLFLAPLMFFYSIMLQNIYKAITGEQRPGAPSLSLPKTVTDAKLLNLPILVWMVLALILVNAVCLGRGLTVRRIIAINIVIIVLFIFVVLILNGGACR